MLRDVDQLMMQFLLIGLKISNAPSGHSDGELVLDRIIV